MSNYKDTLNLPQTAFPMRAGLAKSEPVRLAQWREQKVYERLREARIVIADVAHHSDYLLRLACTVLVKHGETPEEREDARILLVVLDAKTPGRLPALDREGRS